jgi:hypothetical protein
LRGTAGINSIQAPFNYPEYLGSPQASNIVALRIAAVCLFIRGMKRTDDIVVVPVELSGDLREKFSMFFREVSALNLDATPSNLIAKILDEVLEDDILAHQPEAFN